MTAPTTTTPADIAEQRAVLERQRAVLVERRPALALAAASGDPDAITDARVLATGIADLTQQLALLDAAERELRRVAEVRRREQATLALEHRHAELDRARAAQYPGFSILDSPKPLEAGDVPR